jgi:hypothetical protein
MATEVQALVAHDYGPGFGAIPRYAVKCTGLVGLSSAASETVANYIESPFGEDVVITEAYLRVTALDAQDADMDIGLADDAAGTSADDTIFDSPANDALAVLRGLVVAGVAGVATPIWRKKGYATDSFITAQQNGNADASTLTYDLILVCSPLAKF